MNKLLIGMLQIAKLENKEMPEWIVVFKEGKNELEDGLAYLVDEKAFDLV